MSSPVDTTSAKSYLDFSGLGELRAKAQQNQDKALKETAQQFEAILMTQVLREMRRAMVDEDEGTSDGFGAGPLLDTANVELGSALSRAGGRTSG